MLVDRATRFTQQRNHKKRITTKRIILNYHYEKTPKMNYAWVGIGITLLAASVQAAPPTQERRLSVSEYRDKMKAGWIGQIAGVSWGATTEFKWRSKIIPDDMMPKWQPRMINDAFGQDDLYVEMTFLRTMEQYGLDCSIRQAGIDFANSGYALWCANAAGRNNLRKGIAPPDSSHPHFNKCPNDIDYQIEADFSGLIAPGMPNVPIALGEKFGRLMNYGDIDCKINGAYVLLGLLYGKGDLDQTILISCRAGQDSDCNPSSSAGVLFTTLGFSKLPARFTKELNDKTIFSHTAYNVPGLLDVCEKLARQAIIKEGGKIEKNAAGEEFFVLPVKPAKPSKLELSWAPNPIAGSMFTEEERAKITVSDFTNNQ
jgi:hypothetical protein